MTNSLSREAQKLEVRLEDYVKADKEFKKNTRECVRLFKQLGKKIGETLKPEEIEELSRLRRKAIKSLGQAFTSESKVSHEKSHIYESYGALILSLENELDELEA